MIRSKSNQDMSLTNNHESKALPQPGIGCSGMLMALCAKGVQDKYMCDNPTLFDIREKFLTGYHQYSYQQIDVIKNSKLNKSTYKLEKTCDLVNSIDLVLPNPYNLPLNKIIKSISTEVGGQRLDKIMDDIDTIIDTDCVLFKRKKTHINGKTFVPLNLAPLYDHNMIMPSYEYHEFLINVEYDEKYDHSDVILCGKKYMLDTLERKRLHNEPHTFITTQHQSIGVEKITRYVGDYSFKVDFNHPMYLIYFWGFDKTKIKNIRLTLNGQDFYNGSVEILEHHKLSRGYDVEPLMIFFSQEDFDKSTHCTVNFSRIDSASLYISTDERDDKDVYIMGLNLQPYKYTSGMCGLAFSK